MNATKKDKYTIQMNEIVPFEGNMKSRFMTSMELSDDISSLFAGVMDDFCGCKVRINDGNTSYYQQGFNSGTVNPIIPISDDFKHANKGPGNLYVDLYFKFNGYDLSSFDFESPKTAEALELEIRREEIYYRHKSIIPVAIDVERANILAKANKRLAELKKAEAAEASETKAESEKKPTIAGAPAKTGTNISERYLNLMNNKSQGSTFKILPHTYEMLEEFMPIGADTKWGLHTFETTSGMTMYNSREELVVYVTGLDVDKILAKIHGTRDENGIYEYRCLPSTVIANRIDEFVVTVQQLDTNTVRTLSESIGVYRSNPSIYHPAVRK